MVESVGGEGERWAVAVGVTDVFRAADGESEVVTQALLHRPVVALERRGGWMRVRLSDYEGWIPRERLAAAARRTDAVARVMALRARLYAGPEGEEAPAQGAAVAYLSTELPLLGEEAMLGRWQVALPGGGVAWMAMVDGERCAAGAAGAGRGGERLAVALDCARRLLGTPYRWGGCTVEGLDCSGFAQLIWRVAGATILRDADQQYMSIGCVVGRGELQAGDLLFFAAQGAITHVGIMLDGARYIHAKGEPESRVVIHSLDPADGMYHARLANLYAGARRPQMMLGDARVGEEG